MRRAFLFFLVAVTPGIAASSCPDTVFRESILQKLRPVRTVERWLGVPVRAKAFDPAFFTVERARFRARFVAGTKIDEKVLRPEAKAALVVEALQAFFHHRLPFPSDDTDFAEKIFRTVAFSGYALTAVETQRLVDEILSLTDPRRAQHEMASLARVHEEFEGSKEAWELLEGLAQLGVAPAPGTTSAARFWWRRHSHWAPLARSVLTNGALMLIGFPPLDLPNVMPLSFVPLPAATGDALAQGDMPKAREAAAGRLRILSRVHVYYRNLRRVYLGALAGALLYVGVESYPMLRAWYQAATMTTQKLQDHERKHYEPSAVVKEQFQMWRDALEVEPTPEEEAAKWRELEEQERRGVLRVYKP